MKWRFALFVVFWVTQAFSQHAGRPPFLSVSPVVDASEITNAKIIVALNEFLESKRAGTAVSALWLESEVEKYGVPYQDIVSIETGKNGPDSYRPSLMEIIRTTNENVRIVKIAYIGHHALTGENQVRCIYNIVAYLNPGGVKFGLYTNWVTRHWQKLNSRQISYLLSPLRQPDAIEIERQQKAIKALEQFFNTAAPIITYYSCTTPKEVFEIKGFDYHPMMYVDTTGGLADTGNRVFSGNNSEFYSHEIVHLFVQKLFPGCDMFFNEGIAMYLAGSGNHDFNWHKNNVRLALKAVAEINFRDHLGIFARQYVGDTSLPYLTAALVCQRALRLNGTAALPGLMDAKADVWTAMESIGLNRENFNTELHKELQL